MARPRERIGRRLERLASHVTRFTGGSWGFAVAAAIIIVWLATGPLFDFSNTWQLLINTGTTVVTFLMVFLIQRTQNKDSLALQLKLNELVAALEGASNRLIDVEDLDEAELEALHRHYRELAQLAARERNLTESHSIDEAGSRHRSKHP